MSSSVGMMKFPIVWKNKIHVPNHQAVNIWVRLPQDTLWQISITMENRHFQWVNPLFLWPFSNIKSLESMVPLVPARVQWDGRRTP